MGNVTVGAAAVLWEKRAKLAAAKKTEAEARKTEVDVAGAFIDSSGELVEHYRKLVADMGCQIGELRQTLNQHSRQIANVEAVDVGESIGWAKLADGRWAAIKATAYLDQIAAKNAPLGERNLFG